MRYLILLSLLTVGCSSPLAPTAVELSASSTLTVLVSVRDQSTAQPLQAAIHVSSSAGSYRLQTTTDGTVPVSVPADVETTITASAPGFDSFSAQAAVAANGERWTFYLIRKGN